MRRIIGGARETLRLSLSDRAWQWVTVGGLVVFGLTGFIDVADELGFPLLKLVSLGLGVLVLAGSLLDRFRSGMKR